MIRKQGLGLGVVLGLLVASVQSGCGRSAAKSDGAEPEAVGGQARGGDDSVGVGGEAPADGGFRGTEGGGPGSGDGGAGGWNGVVGGEPNAGGAGPELCEPAGRSCDGPSIRVCDADGHSTIEKTCLPSEVCSEAECHPIVCVPDSEFCKDGAIRKCGVDGISSTAVRTCLAGEFCREDDGVVGCSATACTPNELLCVGDVATACRADGSGAKPGGKDCSATSRLCDKGQCVDPTCTPGEKLCEHDDVYLCVGGGIKSVLFTDCTANEVCDPSLAACRTRICEPGQLGCDSTRTAACNALGTGWEQSGVDCAATDQVCKQGACKPRVCTPNAQFCKDGSVYACDADGIASTLRETCNSSYYHCVSYSGSYAYCGYNSCMPGTPVCNGNLLSTCAADGSGALPGGTDCGNDAVCSGNACKQKVCEAGEFCKNDDIYYCWSGGLDMSISTNCADDAPCRKTDAGVACVPYKCWPGLKACVGNKIGTCADDGQTLAVVKQDCGESDQVCVSASSCGAAAIDTLGEADELAAVSNGYFFGDIIDVSSNRALTKLEANIVLAASRDLRWCVFELVNGYYVSRYEKVVNDQSGSGYLSSGALSYTLKAGKTYMLGVAVSGGGAAPYYDSVPWQPDVSFGKVTGGYVARYETQLYSYYGNASLLYDLRVTTQAP